MLYPSPRTIPSAQLVPVDPTLDIWPPAIPTGLMSQSFDGSVVTLSWTANLELDVVGYKLFRDGVQVYNGPEPRYTDAIEAGVAYSYTVVAYDDVGNESTPSAPLRVFRPAPRSSQTLPPGVYVVRA